MIIITIVKFVIVSMIIIILIIVALVTIVKLVMRLIILSITIIATTITTATLILGLAPRGGEPRRAHPGRPEVRPLGPEAHARGHGLPAEAPPQLGGRGRRAHGDGLGLGGRRATQPGALPICKRALQMRSLLAKLFTSRRALASTRARSSYRQCHGRGWRRPPDGESRRRQVAGRGHYYCYYCY